MIECPQDSPQSPLPPTPQTLTSCPLQNNVNTAEILSNTRSIMMSCGIPYDSACYTLIWGGDIPTLVEADENDEEIHPTDLLPKHIKIKAHNRPIADSTKTVHDDSILILAHGEIFLNDCHKLFHTKFMVRRPPRPTQLLREKHTMHCYGLDNTADPVQCWKNHCQDPTEQAFRTSGCVVL